MKPNTKMILGGALGVLMLGGAAAQDRPSIHGSTPPHPPLQKAPPQPDNRLGTNIGFPDFQPTKIKVLSIGPDRTQVEVYVDIKQSGTVASPAAMVKITATLDVPLGGQPQIQQNSVPMLATGTTQRIFVGNVGVPDRDSDWDITINAEVDPPTPARRSGQVTEVSESNNTLSRTCRLYGPDPDLTGPEACD
jgi:hypothetical protein